MPISGIQIIFIVAKLLEFYTWLIIIHALLSWVALPQMQTSSKDSLLVDVYEVLGRLVNPYLNLIRRFVPPFGGVDFSPMVAVIGLQIIRNFLI